MKKLISVSLYLFAFSLGAIGDLSFAFSNIDLDFDTVQKYKIISLSPKELESIADQPYKNLFVYAMKEGGFQPIPFQFEEYSDKGFLFQGKTRGIDEKTIGIFDNNDQLVFMLKDTGYEASSQVLSKFELVSKVRIEDGSVVSYIYILRNARKSDVSYVSYNSETGLISMPEASVQMNPKDLLDWGDVFPRKSTGISTESILDTLKVRISGRFMKIPFHLDNNNLQAKLQNIYTGPVRLTLDAQFRAIVAKVPLLRAHAQIHIDSHSAKLVVNLNTPKMYAKLLEDPQVIVAIDGNALYGGSVQTSVSKNEIFKIDGKMSDEEKSLNDIQVDDDVSWIWLSSKDDFNIIGQFNVESQADYNPDAYTDIKIYYRDDNSLNDKPERFKGALPSLGYQLGGMPETEKVALTYKVFFIQGLKSLGAGEYIDRLDKKVKATSQIL